MSLNRLDPRADLNDPRVRAQLNETLDLLSSMLSKKAAESVADAAEPGRDGRDLTDSSFGGVLSRTIDQSIPDWTGADDYIEWQQVDGDESFLDLAEPTKARIVTTGRYLIDASVYFDTNGSGDRAITVQIFDSEDNIKRSLVSAFVPGSAAFSVPVQVSASANLVQGDYVMLIAYQDSGGALDARFEATYMGINKF